VAKARFCRIGHSVRDLDTAFLRHGRFGYLIPVGPPDDARQAIWDRYLAAMPHAELDMNAIVAQSRLFTPADIEFAARRTAQLVFERVMFEHGEELTRRCCERTAWPLRARSGLTRRVPSAATYRVFRLSLRRVAGPVVRGA
jgi:SpoVK/Ycf46/Vps4 family AAA+-type ATPase